MPNIQNSKYLTYLQALKTDDLRQEIDQKFVYCTWNEEVYERASFKGRVIQFLENPSQKLANSQKVFEIFQEAATYFVKVTPNFKEKLPQRYQQVYEHLAKPKLTQPYLEVLDNPQVAELQKKTQAKSYAELEEERAKQIKAEQKKERALLSLLRVPDDQRLPMSPEIFDQLFGDPFRTSPLAALDYLENYLLQNGDYAVADWQERLNRLRLALQEDETQSALFSNPALFPEERDQKIEELSHEIHKSLLNEGKYSLLLSYGPRQLSLDGVANSLKVLPKKLYQHLPAFLREELDSDQPFETKRIAAKILSRLAVDLKGKLGTLQMDPSKLAPLFGNEARSIPPSIAALLPDVIEKSLNEYLQGGIIGAASKLLPEGIAADSVHWLAMNGASLMETPNDAALLKELEVRIGAVLEKQLEKTLKSLNQGFTSTQSGLATVLPTEMLQILGLEGILASGPLWIELRKQADGLYSLELFTAGLALNLHPVNPVNNIPYAAYRLKDIDPAKLSPAFIHSLLSRHLEPLWNPQSGSHARDIYQGPLQTLQGTLIANTSEDIAGDTGKPASHWQLALNILFKKHPKGTVDFEIRFNALLKFCRSFQTGPEKALRFLDPADQRKVESAVNALKSELHFLKGDPARQKRVLQIEATLEEIESSYRRMDGMEVANLIGSFDLDLWKQLLNSTGITVERLDRWRSTLHWAFGEEVGELADFLVQNLRQVAPKESAEPIPVAKKIQEAHQEAHFGWGLTSYLALYKAFMTSVLEFLFAAIAIQYRTLLDTVRGPLITYLPYLFPPAVEKWMSETLSTVRLVLARAFLKAIWQIALLTPTGKELEKGVNGLRQGIKRLKENLSGETPVSLDIPEKFRIPLPPVEKENEIKFDHVLTSAKPKREYYDLELGVTLPDDYLKEVGELKLDPSSVLAFFTSLNKALMRNSIRDVQELVRFIQSLEIPQANQPGFWDQVENPKECIALLHQTAIYLWDSSIDAFKNGHRSDMVVSFYTLYAIMFHLAKRTPGGAAFLAPFTATNLLRSKLIIPRLNAYPLAKWYATWGTRIEDLTLQKRLKALFDYLLPDVDMEKIPPVKELDKRADETLFSYLNGEPNATENSVLDELAKTVTQEDLLLKGYSIKLKPHEIARVLFLEGFQHRPVDALFGNVLYGAIPETICPPEMIQIRQLSFLCFGATAKIKEEISANTDYKRLKNRSENLEKQFKRCDHALVSFLKPEYCWDCDQEFREKIPEFRNALYQSGHFPTFAGNEFKNDVPNPRSEQEILTGQRHESFRWESDYVERPFKVQERELIHSVPEERLGLLLDYLLKHSAFVTVDRYQVDWLETAFFAPHALEKFIKTRPDGLRQIVEFFSFYIAHPKAFDPTAIKPLHLAIRVKRLCYQIDPNFAKVFPSYAKMARENRDKAKANKSACRTLLELAVLDLMIEGNTDQVAKAFSEAVTEGKNRNYDVASIAKDFGEQTKNWLTRLKTYFSDRDLRNALMDQMVLKLGYQVEDSQNTGWLETKAPLQFEKGAFRINLLTSQVIHEGEIRYKLLDLQRYVFSQVSPLFGAYLASTIHEQRPGHFGSSTLPGIDIQVMRTKDTYQIEVHYQTGGKTYKYQGKKDGYTHWETVKGEKAIFDQKLKAVLLNEQESNKDEKPSKKLPLEAFQKGLEPLAKFVSLSQLKVEAVAGDTAIKTIKIDEYKLSFNVVDGKAQSVEYPGFSIAATQRDPALSGIASYLILENGNRERKVLVPYNQWASAVSWRGFKQLGSIGDYFNQLLNLSSYTPKQFQVQTGVAVYDLQKRDGVSQLRSNDPCNVAYLLVLSILQGSKQETKENFHALEWLCNSQQIPEEIWSHLVPLVFLQQDLEEFTHYRRRIFAMVAETQQIRGVPKASMLKQEIEGLVIAAILKDLRDIQFAPDPRRPINPKQEYFLFKCFEKKANRVAKEILPPIAATLIDKLGWENILDETGVLPNFATRLRKIRQEAGIHPSWFPKIAQWVLKLWKADGTLPEFVMGGNQPSVQPAGFGLEARENTIPGAFDKEGGYFQKFLSVLEYWRDNFIFDDAGLQLKTLRKVVQQKIQEYPVLDPLKITSEIFKRDYLTYYAIAVGEWPYMHLWSDAELPRNKLIRLMQLRKGGWDPQTQVLMKHLEAATALPHIFHGVDQLKYAFKSDEDLAFLFSWDNKKRLLSHFCEKVLIPGLSGYNLYSQSNQVVTKITTTVVKALPNTELVRLALGSTLQPIVNCATVALMNIGKRYVKDNQAGTTAFSAQGVEQASRLDYAMASTFAQYAATYLGKKVLTKALSYAPVIAVATIAPQSYSMYAFTGVGTIATKAVLARFFKRPFGVRDVLGWKILTGAGYVKKAYNAWKSLPSDPVISQPIKKEEISVAYHELQAAEDFFNQVFDQVYKHLFTPLSTSDKIQGWKPFELAGQFTPLEQEKFRQNQKSLNDYYKAQAENPRVSVRLNENVDYVGVACALRSTYSTALEQVRKQEEELLGAFNRPGLKPIDLHFLHDLVEKKTLGAIGKPLNLTDEILPTLALALARIDHAKIRLNQMKVMLETTEALLNLAKGTPDEKRFALLEKLAVELRNKTPLDFKKSASDILRNFMGTLLRFQANSGVLLWDRQVSKIKDALNALEESVVTILNPGMGKTTQINPVLGGLLSNGEQTTVYVFPKSIAGEGMPQTHRVLREALNKVTHTLSFDRDTPLSENTLEGLLILFYQAVQEKEKFQTTKEEALTLRLLLRDWTYSYEKNKHCGITERQIMLLAKVNLRVLELLAIPDETHETYARLMLFCFPVGENEGIPKRHYKMIETTMRLVFNHPALCNKLQENSLVYLDEEEYKTFTKDVVKDLCTEQFLKIKDSERLKAIAAFILNESDEVPAWLKEKGKLYEKVSMVKGILTSLLKSQLRSQAGVKFTPDDNPNEGEFVRPSPGNGGGALPNSMIQLPYETLVKTFVYLNTKGLNENQVLRLIVQLKEKVCDEITLKNCLFEETEVYAAFKDVIPLEIFKDPERLSRDKGALEKIRAEMNKPVNRSRLTLLYTRFNIWKEIRFWKQSILGNPQLFSSLYLREFSSTATPYNAYEYPSRLKVLDDATALGELIDIMRRKCPKGIVETLKAVKPNDVLKEILSTYFSHGSPIQALMDGGALLTNILNEQVAIQILEFCEKNRPDIKAVRFFKPHPVTGKGTLHVMKARTREAVLADTANVPKEFCIDYFSQNEGFGANSMPLGDILCTVGPHHPLYRIGQEASRNRGLKFQQTLQAMGATPIEIQQQKLHFATIQPVKEQIQKKLKLEDKDAEINLDQLFAWCGLNEAQDEENVYQAARDILKAVVECTVENKQIKTSENYSQFREYFIEFKDLLIQTLETDPRKLFGHLEGKRAAKDALELLATQLWEKFSLSTLFTWEEKVAVKDMLDAVPNHPYFSKLNPVTVALDKKEGAICADGSTGSIGINQTMHLTSKQKAESKQRNRQQNQQELQTQQQTYGNAPQRKEIRAAKVLPWPEIEDPTKLDWLKFSSPNKSWLDSLSLTQLKSKLEFYSIVELLVKAKDSALQTVAFAFDSRLWISSNYLERKTTLTPKEIGSAEQLRLRNVLVHAHENPDGTYAIKRLGPLTIEENTLWRNKLSKVDWSHSQMKVFIWDPTSRVIQGGYGANTDTLRKSEDLQMLVDQLRFLDGRTSYTNREKQMQAWFLANNPEAMELAFRKIYEQRGTKKGGLADQSIMTLFNRVNQIPIERLMKV